MGVVWSYFDHRHTLIPWNVLVEDVFCLSDPLVGLRSVSSIVLDLGDIPYFLGWSCSCILVLKTISFDADLSMVGTDLLPRQLVSISWVGFFKARRSMCCCTDERPLFDVWAMLFDLVTYYQGSHRRGPLRMSFVCARIASCWCLCPSASLLHAHAFNLKLKNCMNSFIYTQNKVQTRSHALTRGTAVHWRQNSLRRQE